MSALRTTALLAALLLAGCATRQDSGEKPAAPPAAKPVPPTRVETRMPAAQVDAIAGYFASIAALGPEQAARERADAARAFERQRGAAERLRFAGLLALGPASVRDETQALELVAPLVAPEADRASSLHGLATLLHALLVERAAAATQARELKNQLEASLAGQRQADGNAKDLQKRLETAMAEQKKAVTTAQELQKKLDALKALERSLIDRERAGSARRP